ncbi:hypothetical protein [Bdellovibrio sp. HCB274]|uniref:hypothetical protein n=1 Tax=Bdellovibrio sp. HCB274 TaxID=3394361 RepID=UPI0039B4A234
MKFQVLVIVVMTAWVSISHGWKEVGNAAGITEQNIVYAKENAGTILANAEVFSGHLKTEKTFLNSFIAALRYSTLKFDYASSGSKFSIDGDAWTIWAANLGDYDRDGNGVLSLHESYAVLLDIYALKNYFNPAEFALNRDNLLRILGNIEKTLVLNNFGEELLWTDSAGWIHLFYAGTLPVSFTPDVYRSRLCGGEVTNIKMINPALTSVQKREDSIRLLVVVDSYFECDGKPASKRLPIDLLIKDGRLHLR